MTCPVHGLPTAVWPVPPDDDWDWQASLIQARMDADKQEKPEPDRPTQPFRVTKGGHMIDGRYFIKPADLKQGGVLIPLEPGDVLEFRASGVEIPEDGPCDCLFEVVGWVVALGAYWLEPLRAPDVPA